jgi:hypothetical protein
MPSWNADQVALSDGIHVNQAVHDHMHATSSTQVVPWVCSQCSTCVTIASVPLSHSSHSLPHSLRPGWTASSSTPCLG